MSITKGKIDLLTIIIGENLELQKPERADTALAGHMGLPSRSQLKKFFEKGLITRNKKPLRASDLLHKGDKIEAKIPALETYDLTPVEMPLEIFFEDEYLMVVYKPRGISMHPGAGDQKELTLVHGLMAHSSKLSSVGEEFRPGIVHRLDKNTEGLVVVAKTNPVHESLSKQFATRSISRLYWALCFGLLEAAKEIEAPIGRHPVHRKKMAVVPSGRYAKTSVKTLQVFDGFTWVECKLSTGRTHQIRVHLASLGHPVLNDPVYGHSKKLKLSQDKAEVIKNLEGQCLVAYTLGFDHPVREERLEFTCEKPQWLKILLQN